MATWTPVTRGAPCPVCGKTDWCARSDDGAVHCERSGDPPGGWNLVAHPAGGTSGGIFRLEDGHRAGPAKAIAPPRSAAPPPDAFYKRCLAAVTPDHVRELGREVALTEESLKAVGVGWDDASDSWTFPEWGERGVLVGVVKRSRDGAKRCVQGHKRGLSIAFGLGNMPDPVLAVEGPTDTAACWMMGVAAVGRPGCSSRPDLVAERCKGREIIVVGEFDPKADGTWPGRDGAALTAGKVAQILGRSVKWAMVPDRCKDVRSWMTAQDGGDRRAHGVRLVALLREMSRDVLGPVDQGRRPLLANVVDEKRGGRAVRVHVSMVAVAASLARVTDGWPRRAGGLLFAPGPPPEAGKLPGDGAARFLPRSEDLFAWAQGTCDLRWTGREAVDARAGHLVTPVTKGEFHAHLQATAAPCYESVEALPHHPGVPDAWYAPCTLPPATGEALAELTAKLNPETRDDHDLMVAALITPGWGGPPGRRPAFVFTSDHGSGAGKSCTASLICDCWGGAVEFKEGEKWQDFRQRLLSDDALARRCVLMDNVKGSVSIPGLESTITSRHIDGHRMYVGQFRRPNRVTFYVTANTPSLSRDLADRAVVIHVGEPIHSGDFSEWSDRFLQERRPQLIADVIALLAGEPRCELEDSDLDRWAPWQRGVLTRFPNGGHLADVIRTERLKFDVELEDAEEVASVVADMVGSMGLDPDESRVSIRRADLTSELVSRQIVKQGSSAKWVTRWVRSLMGQGSLSCLRDDPSRKRGKRSWLWVGERGEDSLTIHYERGMAK